LVSLTSAAESGRPTTSPAELAVVSAGQLPATRLAQAVLADPPTAKMCMHLEDLVQHLTQDSPLRARATAYLARQYAMQGKRHEARTQEERLRSDPAYQLTPRERVILDPLVGLSTSEHASADARTSAVHLELRFFGQAAALVDGRPLGSALWQQSKARELFWYALAHGTKGFSREQACADLFPEQDITAGSRSLRNLLYELRKLLRETFDAPSALREDGGLLRLTPADLTPSWSSDLEVLTEHRTRLGTGDLSTAADLPLCVGGRYLADFGSEWAGPFRHYWERAAVEVLEKAAGLCERAGRLTVALACLQRELDWCADDAALVQHLLRLYHALGDTGGVRATYVQHRRAMRQELDADADAGVTKLYRSLVQ
jgi:DNA-binding SARP family transcriptional activator